MVVDMSQKIPGPKDVKAAVQSAAETAQSIAGGAMRIPPASIQLVGQLPDLIENLATATERLNEAVDRAERYLALADPMIRTMDAILPQLEALVATGNDVYNAVASVPGVSTLSRLATRGSDAAARSVPPRGRKPQENLIRLPCFALSPNGIRHCDETGWWSQSVAVAATSPSRSRVRNAAIG